MISGVSRDGLRRSNNGRFWIGLHRKLDELITTVGTERTHQWRQELSLCQGSRLRAATESVARPGSRITVIAAELGPV